MPCSFNPKAAPVERICFFPDLPPATLRTVCSSEAGMPGCSLRKIFRPVKPTSSAACRVSSSFAGCRCSEAFVRVGKLKAARRPFSGAANDQKCCRAASKNFSRSVCSCFLMAMLWVFANARICSRCKLPLQACACCRMAARRGSASWFGSHFTNAWSRPWSYKKRRESGAFAAVARSGPSLTADAADASNIPWRPPRELHTQCPDIPRGRLPGNLLDQLGVLRFRLGGVGCASNNGSTAMIFITTILIFCWLTMLTNCTAKSTVC